MTERVKIFDTTLRDGEQSPGASMNTNEKLRLAVQLEKLGVDIIEAGFPAASEGDFEAVAQIAKRLKTTEVPAWRGPTKAISTRPGAPSSMPPKTPYTHLHRHLGHPPGLQAANVPGGGGQAAVEAVKYAKTLHRQRGIFRPKTAPAATATTCARCSAQPSKPAPPRSTCPTRWVTPFPRSSKRWSAYVMANTPTCTRPP
jgi:hypothetical protein